MESWTLTSLYHKRIREVDSTSGKGYGERHYSNRHRILWPTGKKADIDTKRSRNQRPASIIRQSKIQGYQFWNGNISALWTGKAVTTRLLHLLPDHCQSHSQGIQRQPQRRYQSINRDGSGQASWLIWLCHSNIVWFFNSHVRPRWVIRLL